MHYFNKDQIFLKDFWNVWNVDQNYQNYQGIVMAWLEKALDFLFVSISLKAWMNSQCPNAQFQMWDVHIYEILETYGSRVTFKRGIILTKNLFLPAGCTDMTFDFPSDSAIQQWCSKVVKVRFKRSFTNECS